MPLSRLKACRCGSLFIPASRTAMAQRLFSTKSVTAFLDSSWSGRTMATTRGKSKPPSPKFLCCDWKSSSAATICKASSSYHDGGSSSELSAGSVIIVASLRITKISPTPSPPSSRWPRATRIGGPLRFGRIWERLGIAEVLGDLLADRAFELAVDRAVFVATLHRILVSGSDRDCSSWMEEYDVSGAEGLQTSTSPWPG
jgi:hypothetical protein